MEYFFSDTDPVVQTASGRVYIATMGEWLEADPALLERPSTSGATEGQILRRLIPAEAAAMKDLE